MSLPADLEVALPDGQVTKAIGLRLGRVYWSSQQREITYGQVSRGKVGEVRRGEARRGEARPGQVGWCRRCPTSSASSRLERMSMSTCCRSAERRKS